MAPNLLRRQISPHNRLSIPEYQMPPDLLNSMAVTEYELLSKVSNDLLPPRYQMSSSVPNGVCTQAYQMPSGYSNSLPPLIHPMSFDNLDNMSKPLPELRFAPPNYMFKTPSVLPPCYAPSSVPHAIFITSPARTAIPSLPNIDGIPSNYPRRLSLPDVPEETTLPPHPCTFSHNTTPPSTPPRPETGSPSQYIVTFRNETDRNFHFELKNALKWPSRHIFDERVVEFDLASGNSSLYRCDNHYSDTTYSGPMASHLMHVTATTQFPAANGFDDLSFGTLIDFQSDNHWDRGNHAYAEVCPTADGKGCQWLVSYRSRPSEFLRQSQQGEGLSY